MAVSGNIFSFFLPNPRRRRALPTLPATPQEAALVKGLEEAYAAVDALNLPNEVGENFKKDLTAAFDVRADYRPGYEPGKVSATEVNFLTLAANPFETSWKTIDKSFQMGLPSLEVAWGGGEGALMGRAFAGVWKDVPYTTQQSHLRWLESTGSLVAMRTSRDKGLMSAPGTTLMMSGEMLKHPDVAARVPGLSEINARAQEWEGKISTLLNKAEGISKDADKALSAGDIKKWEGLQRELVSLYKGASDEQEKWGGKNGIFPEPRRKNLVKEFERHIGSGGLLSGTEAANYWRYWKLRDLHYNALNLLRTYKKDGLGGVFRTYVWKEITKRVFAEGTWRYYLYAPNVVTALRKRTVDKLLKPLLNRLTLVRSLVKKIWNGVVGKAVKGALVWLGKKLGLSALGAILGSEVPIVGNAIGAIVGAVVQFVGEVFIKDVAVPLGKIVLYTVGGIIAFFIALSIGAAAVISIILSNTSYPWEQGGSAAAAQRFVQIEVKACDTAAGCSYQNPLKVSNGQHSISWRVVIKNISPGTLTGSEFTFSQTQCTGSGAFDFALAPGAERVAVCSSSFTETDEVVSNVVSFASSGPATNEESVGIVIFGNPPVVLPTGWPVGKGCITQGPDGSYSHGGTEAIDIGSVSTGTAVRATFNGVVQTACWASGDGCDPDGYGNYVRLSSLNGNFSAVFGHLATTSVKSGDQVTVGQQVGTVDNTGNSSGTHLHYEFRSLPMAEPYIPRDTGSHGSIRDCSDASECGLCF